MLIPSLRFVKMKWKTIFILILMFLYLVIQVDAYTPKLFNDINLTLGFVLYIPDTFDNINLTLDDDIGPQLIPPIPPITVTFIEISTTQAGSFSQSFIQATINTTGPADTSNITLYKEGLIFQDAVAHTPPAFFNNFTGLPDGNYTLNGTAFNLTTGENISTSSRNIVLDTTPPFINLTEPTPGDGTIRFETNVSSRVIASDISGLSEILLAIYNASGLVSSNTSSGSPLTLSTFNLANGAYFVNATANDTLNNRNKTETRTFNILRSQLALTLIAPPNATSFNNLDLINFTFQALDFRVAPSCNLLINETINQTITNVPNQSQTVGFSEQLFPLGHYLWGVQCTAFDGQEFRAPQDNRTFFVNPVSLTVQLCPNMTGLVFFPNISKFNITTGQLFETGVQPQNNTICGWTYNVTADANVNLQVQLNNTIGDNYTVNYSGTLVDVNFITIANLTSDVPFFFNVSLNYLGANQSGADFNDTFRVN